MPSRKDMSSRAALVFLTIMDHPGDACDAFAQADKFLFAGHLVVTHAGSFSVGKRALQITLERVAQFEVTVTSGKGFTDQNFIEQGTIVKIHHLPHILDPESEGGALKPVVNRFFCDPDLPCKRFVAGKFCRHQECLSKQHLFWIGRERECGHADHLARALVIDLDLFEVFIGPVYALVFICLRSLDTNLGGYILTDFGGL